MAVIDTFRPVASNADGLLSRLWVGALSAVATWDDSRKTRKALGSLTDRELDDIGLNRGDVDFIAQSPRRGL